MGPALDGALKALEGDLEDEEAASEPEVGLVMGRGLVGLGVSPTRVLWLCLTTC